MLIEFPEPTPHPSPQNAQTRVTPPDRHDAAADSAGHRERGLRFGVVPAIVLSLVVLGPVRASAGATIACGDFDANGSVAASDALRLLTFAVGLDVTLTCPSCDSSLVGGVGPQAAGTSTVCGDVNGSGTVSASDALFLLKAAVGQPLVPLCPTCGSTTTTTLPETGIVDCATGLAPSGETCSVSNGDANLLIQGDVLAPDTVYLEGAVLIGADGKITCVGCDCASQAAGATQVVCPDAVISPALIDLHEHLTFSGGPPTIDTGERYEDRHQWRTGLDGHTQLSIVSTPSVADRQWSELRHVAAGTLSMTGSGSADGLVRNLDRSNALEGLDLTDGVQLSTFPLGDSNGTRLSSGCSYPSITSRDSLLDEISALLHVGQGVDGFAANEARCLTSTLDGGEDLALETSAFVDAIAVGPDELAHLGSNGAGVVWSPRMHLRLYGATTPVTVAARSGVEIGLGTGTTALGSANMFRELACADTYNTDYLDGFFTDRELWDMATGVAADLTATDGQIGRLEAMAFADVIVIAKSGRTAHRAVLEAEPQDLALVLRAGAPLYGDAAAIEALSENACDPLTVCNSAKRACLAGQIDTDFATLSAQIDQISNPIAVCPGASNEPTCTPARSLSVNGSGTYDGTRTADDSDGDGIPNASDSCPTVFDPVLPMHDGTTADADEDGIGDACDPCPLSVACP